MKYILLILGAVIYATGIDQVPSVSENDKEIICFVYHRVGDARYPTTNTSIKDFESHLSYLTKNKFRVLNFSDAIDYLHSDKPAEKIAVITVDDGYKSFYKNGLPLLKKYKLPSTLFINTASVGGGDMMDWKQIEDAIGNGVEIGNHTHSHAFFLNLDESQRYKSFREEIELSQSIIKKNLDITPVVFTFPYGEFDLEMKKIVKEAGFKVAAAQNSGVVFSGTDMLMCPRFPMSEAYSSPEKFAEKAAMKALRIVKVSPENFLLGENKRPLLTLTFENDELRTDQLQCFVQGGECTLNVVEKNDKQVTVTVQASKAISGRRRTLYTVTVPDKKGRWHWYSHLWINPGVKE